MLTLNIDIVHSGNEVIVDYYVCVCGSTMAKIDFDYLELFVFLFTYSKNVSLKPDIICVRIIWMVGTWELYVVVSSCIHRLKESSLPPLP